MIEEQGLQNKRSDMLRLTALCRKTGVKGVAHGDPPIVLIEEKVAQYASP